MYLKQTLDTIVHLLSLGPSGVEQQRCKHGAISAMVGKNLPPMHRGAYFQFIFRWIHYCHSTKSTWKETGKRHLCALVGIGLRYRISSYSFRGNYSFLDLEIQRSLYIRPKVTVRKLFKGGNYMRKYGMLNFVLLLWLSRQLSNIYEASILFHLLIFLLKSCFLNINSLFFNL